MNELGSAEATQCLPWLHCHHNNCCYLEWLSGSFRFHWSINTANTDCGGRRVDVHLLKKCCRRSDLWIYALISITCSRHRTEVGLAEVLLSSTAPASHHSSAATSCRCCADSWEKAVQASSGWCSEPSVQPGVQLVVSQRVALVPRAVGTRTSTPGVSVIALCSVQQISGHTTNSDDHVAQQQLCIVALK